MEKILYILPGQSFTVEATATSAVPGGGGEGSWMCRSFSLMGQMP